MCLSCVILKRDDLLKENDFPQIMNILQTIKTLNVSKIINLANLFKKRFKNEKKDNIFDQCLKIKVEENQIQEWLFHSVILIR